MLPRPIAALLLALGGLLVGCPGGGSFDFDGDGSPDAEDCEPEDPEIHPGANDPYGDGIDQDCGGTDGFDADRDGFAAQDDCNDNDATIHPGADEIEANGIDEDCDGYDQGGGPVTTTPWTMTTRRHPTSRATSPASATMGPTTTPTPSTTATIRTVQARRPARRS